MSNLKEGSGKRGEGNEEKKERIYHPLTISFNQFLFSFKRRWKSITSSMVILPIFLNFFISWGVSSPLELLKEEESHSFSETMYSPILLQRGHLYFMETKLSPKSLKWKDIWRIFFRKILLPQVQRIIEVFIIHLQIRSFNLYFKRISLKFQWHEIHIPSYDEFFPHCDDYTS